MTMAPVMLDLQGTEISAEEKEMLAHPLCGGLILFSRNYSSIKQLERLVADSRAACNNKLLVSVDHEGGRVQRFREGFSRLPALAELHEQADDLLSACRLSQRHAWLMASELRALDIDFSFAPVLDIDHGVSAVIGDRAFHKQPDIVCAMAKSYLEGMHEAGMAATGKHFPGHGAIAADSHHEIPVDERTLDTLEGWDMQPFKELVSGGLDAIMPAHVIYPAVDKQPAGFSRIWLQDILRRQLGFDGVIFSDDLTMEGAAVAGGYPERAEAALRAGCDMVLVCNNTAGAAEVLDSVKPEWWDPKSANRLNAMVGKSGMNRSALLDSAVWNELSEEITALT